MEGLGSCVKLKLFTLIYLDCPEKVGLWWDKTTFINKRTHVEFPKCLIFIGAPRVIRTPDLRIRSPLRYPAALWAQK